MPKTKLRIHHSPSLKQMSYPRIWSLLVSAFKEDATVAGRGLAHAVEVIARIETDIPQFLGADESSRAAAVATKMLFFGALQVRAGSDDLAAYDGARLAFVQAFLPKPAEQAAWVEFRDALRRSRWPRQRFSLFPPPFDRVDAFIYLACQEAEDRANLLAMDATARKGAVPK